MIRFLRQSLAILALIFSASTFADTLLQVYHQAAMSDPTFAQAESTWHSQQMNVPIARAGYLPNLNVGGTATRNYDNFQPSNAVSGNGYTWRYGYTLALTQPIFNKLAWEQIKGAHASVKSATATYLAAQQSLMQRTAQAYFNVMQAYDELRYTTANKRAVWRQLVTARQKYNVGLIAVTDVYDAQSQYDQVVAEEIAAKNNLNIQLENLRAITGVKYARLSGLSKQVPLLKPQPDNMVAWVKVASKQNYDLKAQSYAVEQAMDAVKQEAAGGYPELDMTSNFAETHVAEGTPNLGSPASQTSDETADLGLSLNYNPIQGGLVMASTKQARYNYATASGQLEAVYRNVMNQTRSSYLSILSGISQVQADKQRIISAKNALSATKAGFSVGTRTMVDVLDDMTTLYQAQQQYADDQYAFLSDIIDLKLAAGTLSVKDLAQMSAWLNHAVTMPAAEKMVSQKPSQTARIASVRGKKSRMLRAKNPTAHQRTLSPKPVSKAKELNASKLVSSHAVQLPKPKKHADKKQYQPTALPQPAGL